jgi:hypothetical protein
MDEVLESALAVEDPAGFFQQGSHALDEIYELPPAPPGSTETDLGHPAGIN